MDDIWIDWLTVEHYYPLFNNKYGFFWKFVTYDNITHNKLSVPGFVFKTHAWEFKYLKNK